MTYATYLRRHAKACLKLSEAIADWRLSDRVREMAEDMSTKAREADEGQDWTCRERAPWPNGRAS
jgi:hypothetical protein